MSKNFLGVPSAGRDYAVTYNLNQGTLYLEYYLFDHCKVSERTKKYRGDWNIPEWSVIEIVYDPDNPPEFSTLKLDLRKFKKIHKSPHVPEMVSYVNDQEGVEYTLGVDGKTLQSIRYFPGKEFDGRRCRTR